MTPNVFCLKSFDASGAESWSFCWIEGQPTGSMLQEVNGWVDNAYMFSIVCALVYGMTLLRPHDRLTFSVVVPQAPLAAD